VLDLETFAQSRGFTADELRRWGISVEGDEVIIPILGKAGAWYSRTHKPAGVPKYASPKGATSHLYNPLGLGPQSGEVWIAEGEFDTLSLVAVGAPALGILGTQTFNPRWQLLFDGAEIVLALDPDEAGNSQAERLTQLWPEGQVSRFIVPEPYGDLNDWFKKDRAGFSEAVLGW